MNTTIITSCKKYIEENNLDYLQTYYKELLNCENLDWPTIFQKLYLHACLKGKPDIAEWFENTLYPMMDSIQQIALRQIFPYGKHLLKKSKGQPNTL